MDKTRQQEQQHNGIIRRYQYEQFEVRTSDNGSNTIRGYALRFGTSYDMGWFSEEIHRDALSGANMSDVRILQDHVSHLILGRTSAKTARVWVDDTGMGFEADLPDSPNGQNAREALKRGDITQASWGFRIRTDDTGRRTGDKWEMRDGKEHRIITDVAEVLDASIVSFPANPAASASMDSEARSSRDAFFCEPQQSETRKKELELAEAAILVIQ